MKILGVIALCLSLQGCLWQTASNFDLKRAEYFCEGFDNIAEISIHANGRASVTCYNGSYSQLRSIKRP